MKAKRWIVREHDAERAASLARVLGVSPILAALLINRGYADERAARVFLAPTYDQLHEPYDMLGMKEAVARLQHAITTGERVLIYGDYDVDGTTGTAILLRALKLLNANVGFHIRIVSPKAMASSRQHSKRLSPTVASSSSASTAASARTNHSTGRAKSVWT
jgi:hypothetical protein